MGEVEGASAGDGDIRQDMVTSAVAFLTNDNVKGAPEERKKSFLRGKGLSEAEIDAAFKVVEEGGANPVPPKPWEKDSPGAGAEKRGVSTVEKPKASGGWRWTQGAALVGAAAGAFYLYREYFGGMSLGSSSQTPSPPQSQDTQPTSREQSLTPPTTPAPVQMPAQSFQSVSEYSESLNTGQLTALEQQVSSLATTVEKLQTSVSEVSNFAMAKSKTPSDVASPDLAEELRQLKALLLRGGVEKSISEVKAIDSEALHSDAATASTSLVEQGKNDAVAESGGDDGHEPEIRDPPALAFRPGMGTPPIIDIDRVGDSTAYYDNQRGTPPFSGSLSSAAGDVQQSTTTSQSFATPMNGGVGNGGVGNESPTAQPLPSDKGKSPAAEPVEDPPHPQSYLDVMSALQEGRTIPGIKTIDDKPPDPNQPLPMASRKPLAKPWESSQFGDMDGDDLRLPSWMQSSQIVAKNGVMTTTE